MEEAGRTPAELLLQVLLPRLSGYRRYRKLIFTTEAQSHREKDKIETTDEHR